MKRKGIPYRFVLIFLMLFGLFAFGWAQDSSKKVEDLHQYTEQIYSTDDLLVNGQIYIPARPRAKGSPYFGEKPFVEGSVQIKGRQYEGVLLMYNLVDQRLVLRTALQSGQYVTILLNSNLVDEFTINGQRFINIENYADAPGEAGFFAFVYEGGFVFLIAYKKEFRAVYDSQTPNGSYTKMKTGYFILEDGKLEDVTKKKALLKYFLPVKKEVNAYMRKHKIHYKKSSVAALHQLMKYCDSVSTDN
jgi:hypothetical protein